MDKEAIIAGIYGRVYTAALYEMGNPEEEAVQAVKKFAKMMNQLDFGGWREIDIKIPLAE